MSPQNTKNRAATAPTYTTRGYEPEGVQVSTLQGHLHIQVYCGPAQNSQGMGPARVAMKTRVTQEMWHRYTMEA